MKKSNPIKLAGTNSQTPPLSKLIPKQMYQAKIRDEVITTTSRAINIKLNNL